MPYGTSMLKWLSMVVSCGIDGGEVDHWLAATWHCGGAHLSDALRQGGAHLLTWTNEWVSHGTDGELLWVPKLYPECALSPKLYPERP
jgi:hypothetical protein